MIGKVTKIPKTVGNKTTYETKTEVTALGKDSNDEIIHESDCKGSGKLWVKNDVKNGYFTLVYPTSPTKKVLTAISKDKLGLRGKHVLFFSS